MCFSNGDNGASAAAATQAKLDKQQAEKEAAIKAGNLRIDQAFGQFTPEYYKAYENDYLNAQTPELSHQYDKAKDKLAAVLAGRGVLESTIGANKFADLERTRASTLGEIGNNAVTAANDFRGKVEGQKSDLYNLSAATADPDSIAAQATGAMTALTPPKPTSSLGDIFGSILQPVSGFVRGAMYSPNRNAINSGFNYGTSVRVVN